MTLQHRTQSSRHIRFLVAFLTSLTLLLCLSEGFLRLFPPRDLHPYLGEQSPLTGPFRFDSAFGITYRDWDAFQQDNTERLPLYQPLDRPIDRPLWAMFGNSFVHAPDMLADTARRRLSNHTIFNLGKNELLQVRIAQIELLLKQGFKPDWILFELMPVDLVNLGNHPLDTVEVTTKGAVTYRPRPTLASVDWLAARSRLTLTGLVRLGKHKGNPAFRHNRLYDEVHPILKADVHHLFSGLAHVAKEYDVPVTVLLIPAYHQIAKGAAFTFQETLATMLKEMGLDVCDPREIYLNYPDKAKLFIPDRHFSDEGNRLLLDAVIAHRKQMGHDETYQASERKKP